MQPVNMWSPVLHDLSASLENNEFAAWSVIQIHILTSVKVVAITTERWGKETTDKQL